MLLLLPLLLGTQLARADEDADACTRVALPSVAPLVQPANGYDLRPRSEHPAPGESICHWNAFQQGLTADAPAAYTLIATLYHFANAARARMEFEKTWHGMLAPTLVQTADSTDQVAREDGGGVAVRHGTDIVALDPTRQPYEIQRRPDRYYRLENLAFQMAGAQVRGALDPRMIQNPCSWLPAQHALSTLTTDPSSLTLAEDGLRCTMQVKDGQPDTNHWTLNDGTAEIERQDLGTHAAALRFQHQQTPFLPASTLVKTADAGDRLVWDSQHPEEAWAVHGPFYVSLLLTGVTTAARATPDWLYRTQRLALEAAGATIVPTAGMAPDPVVSGPLPSRAEAPAASGHDRPQWRPPAHDAGRFSTFYDPVLATLAFAARNRFFAMIALVFGPILLAVFLPGRKRVGFRVPLAGLFVLLGIVNVIFGPDVMTRVIYHAGVSGSATITASRETATQYNNQTVSAHTVLIRTADDRIVETGFEDDDFNVYPPHNLTAYPTRGQVFTVRYLKHAPGTFVIVANDGSPWARAKRCVALDNAVNEAASRTDFAPQDRGYQDAYRQAVGEAEKAGCRGN